MFPTLWNVHRFHADYAALDGYDADTSRPLTWRSGRPSTGGSSPAWRRSPGPTTSTGVGLPQGGAGTRGLRRQRPLELVRPPYAAAACGNPPTARTTSPASTPCTRCSSRFRLMAPISPFMVDVIHRNLHRHASPRSPGLRPPRSPRGRDSERGDEAARSRHRQPAAEGRGAGSDDGSGENSRTGAHASAWTPTAASGCRAARMDRRRPGPCHLPRPRLRRNSTSRPSAPSRT